jgi:hypothetical protein
VCIRCERLTLLAQVVRFYSWTDSVLCISVAEFLLSSLDSTSFCPCTGNLRCLPVYMLLRVELTGTHSVRFCASRGDVFYAYAAKC